MTDAVSKTKNINTFAPEPLSAVAGELARAVYKENFQGVRPPSDEHRAVATVTVSISYAFEKK